MKVAAAEAIAELVGDDLAADYIVPSPRDARVAPGVADAVARVASLVGVADQSKTPIAGHGHSLAAGDAHPVARVRQAWRDTMPA